MDEVVLFLDGQRRPLEKGDRVPGPYPYYGASGIIDYVEDYIFDEELVLLSEDGANIIDRNYPICYIASGKYWVNNHAHVLRCLPGNTNVFICNALERLNYTKYNTGSAQPKLNQEICRGIVIGITSAEEQEKISEFLRLIDKKINTQRKLVDALKSYKRGLMNDLFSRKRVFPEFLDTPWEEAPIADLFDCIVDKGHSEETVLTIIQGKGTKPRNEIDRRIAYDHKSISTYKRVIPGDYIVHLRSFEGGLEIANEQGVVSPAYTVLRAKRKISPGFYYSYFHSYWFIRYKLRVAVEGIRDGKSINMQTFWAIKIPVPSLREQEKISSCIMGIERELSNAEKDLQLLNLYRDILLRQLFI